MNLSEGAMRRPVTTMMIFVSLVVVGAIATKMIPLEFFPEFDAPFIFVDLPYQGSSPEEIERQITRPAEEALATIAGIKRMSSWSGANGGNVQLFFEWGSDTDARAMEVREKLDNVSDQFPDDFQRYFVWQRSSSDFAILELRISSNRDLSGAYQLLDRKLKRRMERIDGVSRAELNGVEPRELRIELLSDRVAAHKVNLVELTSNLQRANFAVTAGKLSDANRRFIVRPVGNLTSAEEVENLVISPTGLRLKDIAHVVYDEPILDYGRHLDRSYAVALEVYKESGANTVDVTRRIMVELEELRSDPEMTGIQVYEMDNAGAGIVSSLNELLKSGLLGALLAFLVLFFFLRQISTTLIVSLAVPISLLITVGVLYFVGLSLNILTMMGLMLAVGMLVDNAVVVTESIFRYQQLTPEDPRGASIRGVNEVGLAVVAGTLTTAIVFMPFIVSPADEISIYLKHVSVTICVALAASLLIATTIVPMLTARIRLKPTTVRKKTVVDGLVHRYGRVLDWTIHHRWPSALMSLAILASVLIPAKFVNTDFFDEHNEERRIRLHYHLDGVYTLERVEAAVDQIEEYLYGQQEAYEIRNVYSWYTPDQAQSTILLEEDGDLTQEEIKEKILEGLPKLAIARPSFTWRRSEGEQQSVRVVVHGESSERLAEISEQLATLLDRVPGFKGALSEAERGNEEVHVVIDRDRARQYGLSSQQIAGTVSSAMRGQNLRRFHTDDGEVEMRIQFQDSDKANLDNLRNVMIQNGDRAPVRLANLAQLERTRGPRGIYRENRITAIGVHAQLDDIKMDEARSRLNYVMSQYEFPPGYSWSYGQRFDDDERSQNIMMRNLLLALVLIYLVMAALFESLIHPAAIWTSILFAIVGVFWFFLITDTTFSIMAWIGVFILVGIVVNNGIVLIDHINHLRSSGMPRHEAIVAAGKDRLRPILMTAATTVLGLIPLCITKTLIGGDGPPYFPMARAIVGGLTFSTVVTLLILPTIYIMMDNLRIWGMQIVRFASR